MKRILLIDLGHLAHRYLFTNAPDLKVVGYGLLRHSLLSHGILTYISQFRADEVYIGIDNKTSWRKVLSPIYKANREEIREKSSSMVDWKEFYKFLGEFIQELHAIFPFYVPLVPHLEADDVIGWLVKTLPAEHEKIIVTGDGDYVQLLKYPNTKLWSPNKKSYITGVDPERELLLKIIFGDKSDNIPSITKKCGEKTAFKLASNQEMLNNLFDKDADAKKQYELNDLLIDFKNIPEEYCCDIKNKVVIV